MAAALFISLYYFRGLACDHLCRLPCLCIVACPFDSVEGLLSPPFFARDTIKGVMFLIVDNYRSRWFDAPVIRIFGCLLEVSDRDDWMDMLQSLGELKLIGVFAYPLLDLKWPILDDA